MSWLTGIASKAEDLLNQVDKTAASALQNKHKYAYGDPVLPTKKNFYDKEVSSEILQTGSVFTSTGSAQSYWSTPLRTTKDNAKQSQAKPLPIQKKKPESDDEKLMEFLNSSDTVPALPTNDTSLPKILKHEEKSSMIKSDDSVSDTSAETSFIVKKVTEMDYDVQESRNENSQNIPVIPTSSSTMEIPIPVAISSPSSENENQLPMSEEVKENPEIMSSSLHSLEEKQNVSEPENELHTLRQDLLHVQKRAMHAEAERRRMQKKLEHWNSQISGNDKHVRELMDRETDLMAAIEAKDSQLAVLKVRLQEADQALAIKNTTVEDLKAENERLMKDQTNAALCHNQMQHTLQEKFQDVENELRRDKEIYHAAQTEHFQRMNKMEEEQKSLAENFANQQKQLAEVKEKNKELVSQLKATSVHLENLQEEYTDYKQKAQRILQSKERLIMSLKDTSSELDNHENESMYAVLCAEIEEVKQERDLLREELRKVTDTIETYKSEVQELEKMAQNDSDSAREHVKNLEEQLRMEKLYKEELELLNNQLKEELMFLREDLVRSKNNFQSRVQDREIEIEKLRRQLMAKSLSTVSQDELESRLHALTENLIQKQTIVEALSTEKNSLVLQLERLEQHLKEAQSYGSQHHTVVGVSTNETERKLKSAVFSESPFDSSLTRKVKRMYGSIDAFSVRLGVFFRRYPVARVFVIVYMLLLHLWVMIVLLTYQPEVHNYSKQGTEQS